MNRCGELIRKGQWTKLVWTGPDVEATLPRRTEQALLQVIGSAKTPPAILSVVAHKVPRVAQAIASAAHPDVAARLILEDPEVSQGKVAFAALGPDVTAKCQVYVWPLDSAPRTAMESTARSTPSVRSPTVAGPSCPANLTERALTVNLGLGVLIAGGPAPSVTEKFFDSMVHAGTLAQSPTTRGLLQPPHGETVPYCPMVEGEIPGLASHD